MEQLYVKTNTRADGHQHLLGIISNNNGEFSFEYKLGNHKPEWYEIIKEFPDTTKKYQGKEVENFINRLIPQKFQGNLEIFLEEAGIEEYDMWALLKTYGKRNMRADVFVVSTLPKDIICYE